MGIWGYLTLKKANKPEEENLKQVHPLEVAFASTLLQNDQRPQFFAAEELLNNNEYHLGIKAYERLACMYPEERCFCELQIANAYCWLGEFSEAFRFLLASRVHGGDESQIDQYYWQFCLSQIKQNPKEKIYTLEQYLMLFPTGIHRCEALQILEKTNQRH